MKTTAAVLTEINKPLQIEELSIPPLKKGQVLIKVAYSGICHSQLNEIRGMKGEDRFLPHTLGHEGSGIVLETGPDVTKVKPEDHVVLTWIKGNGHDVPSTQYIRKNGSFVNSGAISTFLSHAIISENRLVSITKQMPLKESALLGCAIPTGAGIVNNTAKIKPGQTVAVFGCGGIGLSAILMAGSINMTNKTNCTTIIAIDIMDTKLNLAQTLGATHIINAHKTDSLKSILDITNGQGVDFAIEAAGLCETMETAFCCVKDNGGLCILAGNLPHGKTIQIDPFNLIKGKRIVGTWGGETSPDYDIPLYEKSILSGKIDLKPLITQNYLLPQINDAVREMETGAAGRSLIKLHDAS